MDILFFIFYGTIFISFGLGIILDQLININGFYFFGIGFIFLIISLIKEVLK